jgi:hypothetical protein
MGDQMAATPGVPGTRRKSDAESAAVIGHLAKQPYLDLLARTKKANRKSGGECGPCLKNWGTTTSSLG